MEKQVFRILLNWVLAAVLLIGCSANTGTSTVGKAAGDSTNASASTGTKTDSGSSTAGKSEIKGFGKVLVVYYSMTGNTRDVANIVKSQTGADIFEIKSEFDYYREDVEEVAQKHLDEGYLPKLTTSLSNVDDYDTIFIGSPVWWYSVSTPVRSFLSQYNLKNKTVVPFCTCGTTSGGFFKDFEGRCSGAKVLKGIDFTKAQLADKEKVKKDIGVWLDQLI